MMRIESAQNPRLKDWRRLREKSGRKATGLLLVEGARLTEEALTAAELRATSELAATAAATSEGEGASVERRIEPPTVLLIREDAVERYAALIARQEAMGVECLTLSARAMKSLADTVEPQALMAVLPKPTLPAPKAPRFCVVADGVRDPGNMGTLIRTADAVGADVLWLSGDCADAWSPKVLRSSMGSCFHLPIREDVPLKEEVAAFVARGGIALGGHLEGAPLYEMELSAAEWRGPVLVVVGSEAFGMRPELAEVCSHKLRIPMPGKAESLNAAVAAGVLLYEVLRRRMEARA